MKAKEKEQIIAWVTLYGMADDLNEKVTFYKFDFHAFIESIPTDPEPDPKQYGFKERLEKAEKELAKIREKQNNKP